MNPAPSDGRPHEEQRTRKRARGGPRLKDWRRTMGVFANDPVFDEIVRLGRQWRERDKPKR